MFEGEEMKDEALKLALDELMEEYDMVSSSFAKRVDEIVKQALAAPVQDSTCSETLRAQGKAYPRTCRKCGLGPCIGAPKQSPAAQRQSVRSTWVGLTDEERESIVKEYQSRLATALIIEAKLKEKNT
jgi:hypothetical protein